MYSHRFYAIVFGGVNEKSHAMLQKLLITASIVFPAANAVAANNMPLDNSCRVINDAYIATRTTDRYREMISSPEVNGSLKPFSETIFNGQSQYTKYAFAGLWKQSGRGWSLSDSDGPKFTNCEFLSKEHSAKRVMLHFSATWHKHAFVAHMDVWVYKSSGKIAKTLRKYLDDNWEFSRPVLIEVFDYDTNAAVAASRTLALAPP